MRGELSPPVRSAERWCWLARQARLCRRLARRSGLVRGEGEVRVVKQIEYLRVEAEG